jgi:ABC-type branched-subunit amino acid transport system ATPase component
MLTQLTIRNFKRFESVQIELGGAVVFVGPNNSGKTSALQALALWDVGLRRWNEKRTGRTTPEKRPGVTINRRDLISVPVPEATLLWRDLHVRDVVREDGRQRTENVRVEIVVDGVTEDRQWTCGLEFDYANDESIYCRPLRNATGAATERMAIPDQASTVRVAFLPPMSGLAATEDRLDPGAISVRIGEGRTAEVLRNLCYRVLDAPDGHSAWPSLCGRIRALFGVELDEPRYIPERGSVVMTYRDRGATLDLSSSGRGLQQTLLLLAYLQANPGSVLLLDEPDAHLEIIRQRQIYDLVTAVAAEQRSQVVIATHSEVLLNEAADRDLVVAFLGTPHRIDDRGTQLRKALKDIGYDQYLLAELRGWVLYLEGATDLAILKAFAQRLGHAAADLLQNCFVHYVENRPKSAEAHFHGLREAKPDLAGIAIFDRVDAQLTAGGGLTELMWRRYEIENYLWFPETLEAYASQTAEDASPGPLFGTEDAHRRASTMRELIADLVPPVALRDRRDSWWTEEKASAFLDRLLDRFFAALGLPNLMRKTDYHLLTSFVPLDLIDREISEKLDLIVGTAREAVPRR